MLSSTVHSLFEPLVDAHRRNIYKCCCLTKSWEIACAKMATYTKHIHCCAYRDRRYKSQAAAKDSRSQGTQDVRGKAQRLSEATTRYSEVNRNRRDIESSKFWGKRQQTTCVYAQFCCWLSSLTCRWCLFCSEGDEVLLQRYGRGDVCVRESRVRKSK